MSSPTNTFGVVRRVVPSHGYKVGCTTQAVANGLTREQADELATLLQADNPDEEYAVIEMVFHNWTKG